jgi:muramoyltetrapeptide carboxypeptidase
VVAPASAPRDLDRYRTGLARLRTHYDVRTAWAPGRQQGYLAAPDAVRAAALHQAIRDPAIDAIFCVRGGYGCLRLLHRLDWALARQHPTLLVGYSDVTALHLALYARAGWTGLSGPVVTEWAVAEDDTLDPFRALAEGGTPSVGPDTLRGRRPGTATGPLLGGNLSVLTRLVGTPYAPDWSGAVLVIEDVAEASYRIDRMLAHLRHAGVLDAVAGVVLGAFSTGDADHAPTLSLDTVFRDYFTDRPYPVADGLPYGHLLPRCSLPIGVPVRLTVGGEGARLSALAPVVAA